MTDHLSVSIASLAAGDVDALATVYDRTSRLVYSLARRILRRRDEAEEVVMDVYAQVWRTAGDFDGSRGTVEGWLLMMTRARAIDRLRARTARPDVEGSPLVDQPDHDTAVRMTSVCDARKRLQSLLVRLQASDRRLIELAFLDGYTHRELAALLGVPLGTVKTRLRNSLQRLRRPVPPDCGHRPRLAWTDPSLSDHAVVQRAAR